MDHTLTSLASYWEAREREWHHEVSVHIIVFMITKNTTHCMQIIISTLKEMSLHNARMIVTTYKLCIYHLYILVCQL